MQLLNDIRRYNELSPDRKIYLISFLTALSGVFSVVDTMIPKPIPMAKIGVANIVTLILILEGKIDLAFIVAFFRTLVAGVMLGSILSYTYLLSLTGALASVFFSALFYKFMKNQISEVGLSVIGAFFNTAAQGVVVILFFGFDRGTSFLISLFMLFSVMNGAVIGWIVKIFYKRAGSRN
jgi:heptaprenyl diphosphate synthase